MFSLGFYWSKVCPELHHFTNGWFPSCGSFRTIFGDQQWRWFGLSSSPRLQRQQHSILLRDGPWRGNHRHDQDTCDRKPPVLQEHKQPPKNRHLWVQTLAGAEFEFNKKFSLLVRGYWRQTGVQATVKHKYYSLCATNTIYLTNVCLLFGVFWSKYGRNDRSLHGNQGKRLQI